MSESNRFLRDFPKGRAFLPVIHMTGRGSHAEESIRTALEAGADGVFLINQGSSAARVLEIISPLRAVFGDQLWIGVNLLGFTLRQVIQFHQADASRRLDGIWTDDAGVDSLSELRVAAAKRDLQSTREMMSWDGIYFGGTAFKTQMRLEDQYLPHVAQQAAEFVDVVTTSGDATGVAADPHRVQLMRDAIPDTPMGLASGITPENVTDYLPAIQAFLVASGIEEDFGILDPERTRRVAEVIHGCEVP